MRRPRFALASLTLRFAFPFGVLLAAAPAFGQGRIEWAAASHDFASLAEGEQATHVFTFTNAGDRPLTLAEVRAACGCTTPTYTREPVAPGGRGEVTVVYNSQGRPGPFEKDVFVRANGAEPAEHTLRITGTVVPDALAHGVPQGGVVFDADTFDFPPVAADAPLAHTFRMQNAGARPVRIRAARAASAGAPIAGAEVAFPDRPVFPGEVVDIAVTVPAARLAADAAGRLDVAVVLDTDDAAGPAKSLRLRGQVEG